MNRGGVAISTERRRRQSTGPPKQTGGWRLRTSAGATSTKDLPSSDGMDAQSPVSNTTRDGGGGLSPARRPILPGSAARPGWRSAWASGMAMCRAANLTVRFNMTLLLISEPTCSFAALAGAVMLAANQTPVKRRSARRAHSTFSRQNPALQVRVVRRLLVL